MNEVFHRTLLVIFNLLNTILLFLFLLQLPYGVDSLVSSLTHWAELSPGIGIAAGIAFAISTAALLLVQRLPGSLKSSVLYLRRHFAHPGHRVFFGGKNPGFKREPLLKAHPEIHDSAYNPQVQMQVWQRLFQQNAKSDLVVGTSASWQLLRNLYVIALVFLICFFVAWTLNFGVPTVLALSYLFIYGTQTIFLLFSARKTGERLANNVLAAALGIKP